MKKNKRKLYYLFAHFFVLAFYVYSVNTFRLEYPECFDLFCSSALDPAIERLCFVCSLSGIILALLSADVQILIANIRKRIASKSK